MKEFPDIPGYVIKKKLGRGGMADVYLAVQEKLSRLVAVKVLIPERFSTLKMLKRFVKESQIASKLSHPNIVAIYDVGKVDKAYYMVMEYLPETLKERIRRRGRFEPEEALHILLRLAGAVYHAHRQGFIHRDIKSENIMFRKDGSPVIVDFGIARAIDTNTKLTQTGIFLGTPNYMSPEQCLGKKLDGRSDVYSLGVVFFEMLTGSTPYKGGDMRAVVIKHLQAEVPGLPFSLRRFQPLIDRMMAKKRRQRPDSEAELLRLAKPLLSPLAIAAGGGKEVRRKEKSADRDKTHAVMGEAPMDSPAPGKPIAAAGSSPGLRRRRFRWRLVLNLLLLVILVILFLILGGKVGYFGLDKLLHFR